VIIFGNFEYFVYIQDSKTLSVYED